MSHPHPCPCNWRECHSYTYDKGDPWEGVFRISPGDNPKNSELRRVVEHHLKIQRQVRNLRKEYWVTCHHWNRSFITEQLKPNPTMGTRKSLAPQSLVSLQHATV